jgi:hypothetical protein
MSFKKQMPEKDIIINNRCKLIHLGESKMNNGNATQHNKQLFAKRWGVTI